MTKYNLIIREDSSGNIGGQLFEYTPGDIDNPNVITKDVSFDVRTVIGDSLIENTNVYKDSTHTTKSYDFMFSEQSPLFLGKKNHYGLRDEPSPTYFTNPDTVYTEHWFNHALARLNAMSLSQFEILKASTLMLTFTYQVSIWEDKQTTTTGEEINLYRWHKAFDPLPMDESKQFSYLCNNFHNVVFSILHYYIIANLKVQQCRHCGKLFAVEKLSTDYCSRQSPYVGYESYTCPEAVKKIKDKLEKKRLSEYERLRIKAAEYGVLSNHQAIFNEFCSTSNDFKDRIRQTASVELLTKYQDFLYDSQNVRRKYERIR